MLEQIETAPRPAAERSCGLLPPRMKTLYITTPQRPGRWLAEALASDSASHVLLEEVEGAGAGLARLRDEVFDAILISHEPGSLDAIEIIEGLRAGGGDEPMIVLGDEPPQDLVALCFEVGADAYCYLPDTSVRALIWTLARAVERQTLVRENRQMAQAQRVRLQHEHQEAERLLNQQRSLVTDLKTLCAPSEGGDRADPSVAPDPEQAERPGEKERDDGSAAPAPNCSLPDRLVNHYRELLRAYVIMGTGNLSDEMAVLAEMLAGGGVTARHTMRLHLDVLEELIRGLGARSARHVINRADLLVMEVMVHLAEGYRRRYLQHTRPVRQLDLPGFNEGAPAAFS